MDYQELFFKFEVGGKLQLPEITIYFSDIPWVRHPVFDGVELKHIVTSKQTNGLFSYHLVRIAPNKRIGSHVHTEQLETHEVIAGNGICMNNEVEITYEPGVVSIFQMDTRHEVIAGQEGLYLFAKFMPALT